MYEDRRYESGMLFTAIKLLPQGASIKCLEDLLKFQSTALVCRFTRGSTYSSYGTVTLHHEGLVMGAHSYNDATSTKVPHGMFLTAVFDNALSRDEKVEFSVNDRELQNGTTLIEGVTLDEVRFLEFHTPGYSEGGTIPGDLIQARN